MAEMFSQVSRVFNLSRTTGVEQWAHLGINPDWHMDAFGGTRMAVALNPWEVKPEGY